MVYAYKVNEIIKELIGSYKFNNNVTSLHARNEGLKTLREAAIKFQLYPRKLFLISENY